MKCKNCGKELTEGTNFCENCGTPVSVEQTPVFGQSDFKKEAEAEDAAGRQPETDMSQSNQAAISIRKSTLMKAAAGAAGVLLLVIAAAVVMHMSSDKTTETANTAPTAEGTHSAADYDTDVWDYRLPEPPGYVSQEFYAIFYEKSRDNRIELAVFDIEGELDGNYIVWSGTGEPLLLYNQNVIKSCDQFYYDGSKWVEFNSDYYRIGDSAKNIISSNLDIRDSDGKMVQPHITSSGISDPLDLSQYQKEQEPAEKEEGPAPSQERTVEKIYVYPESSNKVEKVYVYPENGSDGYILPGSDYRYISKSELYGLSALQLRLARNEIYARYGRIFKDQGLQQYFDSCSWYYPSVSPDDFSESWLNKYEKANRDVIVEYEKDMGYR